MDILAGILFGGAIIGLGYVTRQGRAIPFYSTVLIVIALGYVLFAVMAGAPDVLWVESAIAIGFIALAVVGARWPYRRRAGGVIAAGLALHGGFDLVHDTLVQNPAVPSWWPAFCAVVDVVVGLWLIGLMVQSPHTAPATSSDRGREAAPSRLRFGRDAAGFEARHAEQ